jgi:hypothetical protein
VPTSFEDFLKNYMICMGTSVANFAANKRGDKVKVHDKNRPILLFKGNTSRALGKRIQTDGDRRPLSDDAITEWLPAGQQGSLFTQLAAVISSDVSDLMLDYFKLHNKCREVLVNLTSAFARAILQFYATYI